MSDKNKRPSMSDFGLLSYMGNAPEWTEQGKKQAAYVEALAAYEAAEESGDEHKRKTNRDGGAAG